MQSIKIETLKTIGSMVSTPIAIILGALYLGTSSPMEPQYKGINFEGLVNSFDELKADIRESNAEVKGSLATLSTTMSAQLSQVTKDIQDGQRRMDGFDLKIAGLQAIVDAHARILEQLRQKQ